MKTELEYLSLREVKINGKLYEASTVQSWSQDVEQKAKATCKYASRWYEYGVAKAILEMVRESSRTKSLAELRRFVQPCIGKPVGANVSKEFDPEIKSPYVEIVTYDPATKSVTQTSLTYMEWVVMNAHLQ